MKQVHLDPAVMSVVDIDKMSEKLKKAFSLLEIIQKGLHTVRLRRLSAFGFDQLIRNRFNGFLIILFLVSRKEAPLFSSILFPIERWIVGNSCRN